MISKTSSTLNLKYMIGVIIVYLLMPLVLLISGGDPTWWQGWLYSLLIVVAGIIPRILGEKKHPGLLEERSRFVGAEDIKSWDRVLSPLMAISMTYPVALVAGLDHNFGWSPNFPLWLNLIGFVLIVCGYTFAGWALVENRFFSSVVRIQKDRGHMLCDSGPYSIVRHPGYAGNVIALPGILLALGSIWVIVPIVVALIVTIIRTRLEDGALQDEMPGYKDYASRVRYRIIPGIF